MLVFAENGHLYHKDHWPSPELQKILNPTQFADKLLTYLNHSTYVSPSTTDKVDVVVRLNIFHDYPNWNVGSPLYTCKFTISTPQNLNAIGLVMEFYLCFSKSETKADTS